MISPEIEPVGGRGDDLERPFDRQVLPRHPVIPAPGAATLEHGGEGGIDQSVREGDAGHHLEAITADQRGAGTDRVQIFANCRAFGNQRAVVGNECRHFANRRDREQLGRVAPRIDLKQRDPLQQSLFVRDD